MSAGVSAVPDYAGIGRRGRGIEANDHGRGRAQGSALFADVRQHPIGDRGTGDDGNRQAGRAYRRRERKTERVYRKRPRFSRARGLSHRARVEVSALAQERALGDWLAKGLRCMGQIAIECGDDGTFALTHRDDAGRNDLIIHHGPHSGIELARFDDAGKYRPLKTAPNFRHGWKLIVQSLSHLRLALDAFYPGRLAAFFAFESNELRTTPFRETLERQSGMYRIAAPIDEEEA